jgi:hypothetical protein
VRKAGRLLPDGEHARPARFTRAEGHATDQHGERLNIARPLRELGEGYVKAGRTNEAQSILRKALEVEKGEGAVRARNALQINNILTPPWP